MHVKLTWRLLQSNLPGPTWTVWRIKYLWCIIYRYCKSGFSSWTIHVCMILEVGNFEKFTILSDAGQPHSRVAASARLRLRTHRHAMTCHLRSKVVQLGSPSIFCVATWASSSKTLSIARPTGVSACADDYQVKTKINHLPAMLQTYLVI